MKLLLVKSSLEGSRAPRPISLTAFVSGYGVKILILNAAVRHRQVILQRKGNYIMYFVAQLSVNFPNLSIGPMNAAKVFSQQSPS